MDREQAAVLGREAVELARTMPGVAEAIAGTRTYVPGDPVEVPAPRFATTAITVTGESTLAATRRLPGAAALNFASAKNAGGGFLRGDRTQEESLARSSALFLCLDGSPMYAHHRAQRDPMYGDWVIHSPSVPVFRDDAGDRVPPYPVSFLTSPAVEAKDVLAADPSAGPRIAAAMAARIARVLAVAAAHRHDTLVLGAWGCGVFGNDPELIAGLFADALAGPFRGHFATVVFAILGDGPIRDAFARRFP